MKVRELISSLLVQHFARKEILPPDEWTERNIRLTRQSIHKGRFSHSRTPFFRQIYSDMVNPEIRQVSLMKPAQLGFSQLAANILLFYVCNFTLPLAMFFPSQGLSQQFMERTLEPAIETTRALKEYLTGNKDHIRRNEIIFTSCILKIIGSGSANKLSSNPLAVIVVDEADKLEDFEREANPLDLIRDRQISFHENGLSKLLIGSTPTIGGASLIESEFLRGSQSRFHVKCPHCQTEQVLKFENIQFGAEKDSDGDWNLDEVKQNAYYKCPHCSGAIREEHRLDMLNSGRWIDGNPKAPKDHRSYHINCLYNLNLTFGLIAVEFLKSKESYNGLQNFYNSWLGEPWIATKATVSETHIQELISRSPAYNKRQIPSKPRALLIASDTQGMENYYMVAAVLENNALAVIDWGITVAWSDLALVGRGQYEFENEFYGIYGGFVDAGGNRTGEVYNFCLNSGSFWVPIFGRTSKHKMFSPVRRGQIPYKDTQLNCVFVNDTYFTDGLLTNSLKMGSESIYLPQDADATLIKHLSSTSIISKKDKNGFSVNEYKVNGENHWFDCLKYLKALYFVLLPQLMAPEPELEPEEPQEEQPQQNYAMW